MKYNFWPSSGAAEKQQIEMPDCKITGNTVQYELDDNSIMSYSLDDAGNVRKNSGKEVKEVKLTSYQLSVFEAIKGRDGNSEVFDKDDLKGLTEDEALKLVNDKLGENSNYKAVEAQVEKKSIIVKIWDYNKREMKNLQIDFKSEFWDSVGDFFKKIFKKDKSEKKVEANPEKSTKPVASIQVGKLEEQPIVVTEQPVKADITEVAQPEPVNINIENGLLTTFYEKHIPKEYAEHIKKAAEKADVSENLVKLIIMTEGRSKGGKYTADLTPYKCKSGVLTIGFGHTNTTETFKVEEETEITLEKAFEILVEDIKEHKKCVINSVGKDNYEKLLNTGRESLAEALIDWSFNAGSKRLRTSKNVKLNIEKKWYFGLATTSLWNESDPRRSIMRMLYAVDYMKPEDKQTIRERFLEEEMRVKSDSTYYASVESKLVGGEKDIVLAIINQYLSE